MAGRLIPARSLHTRIAGPSFLLCAGCGCASSLIHHDHLMDYAKEFMLERLRAAGAETRMGPLWDRTAASLITLVRFQPVRTCALCNSGDGAGKCSAQLGGASPVYDRWFSMTLEELREVRSAPRLSQRIRTMRRIWTGARDETRVRRTLIERWIHRVLAEELLSAAEPVGGAMTWVGAPQAFWGCMSSRRAALTCSVSASSLMTPAA